MRLPLLQSLVCLVLIFPISSSAQLDSIHVQQADSIRAVIQQAEHDTTKAWATYQLSKLYYDTSKDSAIALANRAKALVSKADWTVQNTEDSFRDKALLSLIYQQLGDGYFRIDEFEKARAAYEKCIQAKREGKLGGTLLIYNNLANTEIELFEYDRALEVLFLAIDELDSVASPNKSDTIMLASTYNFIGIVHHQLGDWEACLKNSLIGLDLAKAVSNYRLMAALYSTIATYHYNVKRDTANAQHYFELAIDAYQKNNDDKTVFYVLQNLAVMYERKAPDKALTYLKRAQVIAEKYQRDDQLAELFWFKARIEYEARNTKQAEQYALKSLAFCGDKHLREKVSTADLLTAIYVRKKEWKKAYYYKTVHIACRDSIQNLQNQKKAFAVESNYKMEKLKAEEAFKAEILKRESELKDQRIKGLHRETVLRNLTIVLIVGGSLLLGIISFLWFRGYKRKVQVDALEAEKEIKKLLNRVDVLQSNLNTDLVENTVVDPEEINRNLEKIMQVSLTKRESEVLIELCKGKENKEIAESLFISINTVRTHLLKIYSKMDVKTRVQAVKKAQNLTNIES